MLEPSFRLENTFIRSVVNLKKNITLSPRSNPPSLGGLQSA